MSAQRKAADLPTVKRASSDERYRTVAVKVSAELGQRFLSVLNRLDRQLPDDEKLSRNGILVEMLTDRVAELEALAAKGDK